MVASVIAACGAPVLPCGSCCDPDCCEALGCSCAGRGTIGTTRSAANTQVASRIVIGRHIAGQIVVGQALRLLVAAVPVGGVQPTRVRNENALRTRLRSFGVAGSESGYSLTDRSRSAFAVTETE